MGLTNSLLERFGRKISKLILIPSDGGRFEIKVNGVLIFSKLKTGAFPEAGKIFKEIEQGM